MFVSALGKRPLWIILFLTIAVVSALVWQANTASYLQQPAITVDPGVTFQTISGWEAAARVGHRDESGRCLGFTEATTYGDLRQRRYESVNDNDDPYVTNLSGFPFAVTAMLEHIGADYQTLHHDLTRGRNSAWQRFVLSFLGSDDGTQYFWIDQSNPDQPIVNMGSRTSFLRQYVPVCSRWGRQDSGSQIYYRYVANKPLLPI